MRVAARSTLRRAVGLWPLSQRARRYVLLLHVPWTKGQIVMHNRMDRMTEPTKRELRLEHELREIATTLRNWAIDSKTGGWSTHQVDLQRVLADRIDEVIRRTR